MAKDQRIIALNIRSGGGQRVDALLQYLGAREPDTVVLTEWRSNKSGQQIAAWAEERGLHHASLADGGTANGIFVAARTPFISEKRTPLGDGAGVLSLARFERFSMLTAISPKSGPRQLSSIAALRSQRSMPTPPFCCWAT
jgi:hypothetical protein